MLSKLIIENYALIDRTEIDFSAGFTVITGETGAGKSIMLDALSLIMGARASGNIITDQNKKIHIEAIFTDPSKSIEKIFNENGIDWDNEELIIRREITASGKTRSFVNDTPVNLTLLSEITKHLVDIHSQHANIVLTDEESQLRILDDYENDKDLFLKYQTIFKNYVELRNQIREVKESIEKKRENKEYIRFRLEQLNTLKPKEGEIESLERELDILSDADRIQSELSRAREILNGDGLSIVKNLNTVSGLLSGLDLSLLEIGADSDIGSRLESMKIELRDISDTLERFLSTIKNEPERLEKVQKRLNLLYEALNRFKVKDDQELIKLHNKLREEFNSISGENSDLKQMERVLKEQAQELKNCANALSMCREEAAERFGKEIEERARPLGLANLKIEIKLTRGKMTINGQDKISFMCSFNKNMELKPISMIASGGEISRVMLALKSVMADSMKMPTIIFDEIDTGVSGEIADKMGKMMKNMAVRMQVMAVTHLPQVASSGDSHLKVYKTDSEEKTVSNIRTLSPSERIEEIAGMLSGKEINEAAINNAKVLLTSNGKI